MTDGRKALAAFGSLLILAGPFMPFLMVVAGRSEGGDLTVMSYLKLHPYESAAMFALALASLELTRRGLFHLLFLPAILAALGLLHDGFKLIQHPDMGVHTSWGWAFFVIGPLALLACSVASLLEPRPQLPPAPDDPDPGKVDIG